MKTLWIAVLTFFTIVATAQRGNEPKENLTAEEATTLRVKKMTLALALDDSQAKKVYELLLPQAKERKEMIKARKQAEDLVKPSKEERLKKVDAHLDQRISLQREMKEILTEDQFAQYQKMQLQRGKRRHKGRKGAEKGGKHRHQY